MGMIPMAREQTSHIQYVDFRTQNQIKLGLVPTRGYKRVEWLIEVKHGKTISISS